MLSLEPNAPASHLQILAWGLKHEAVPARKLAIKCCAAWFATAAPAIAQASDDDADCDHAPLLQQMLGSLCWTASEDRHSSVRSQALDCLGTTEVRQVVCCVSICAHIHDNKLQ